MQLALCPSLTDGDFFDELGGSVGSLHQGPGPRRQVPVGLHPEDVGLDAPPRARPRGKDQVRALGGGTSGAAGVDQSGGRDEGNTQAGSQRHRAT